MLFSSNDDDTYYSKGSLNLLKLFHHEGTVQKNFRYFIEGCSNLELITDHEPLCHAIHSKTTKSAVQQRYLQFISMFTSQIHYLPGHFNVVADYFTRAGLSNIDIHNMLSLNVITGARGELFDFVEFAKTQSMSPE